MITGVWISADRTRVVIERDTHRSVVGINTNHNDAKTHEPELVVMSGADAMNGADWVEVYSDAVAEEYGELFRKWTGL